jgi:L-malate glycosyltransferase
VATLLAFPLARKGGISTFVAGLLPALERRFVVRSMLIAPDRTLAKAGDVWSQARVVVQQLGELVLRRPQIVHTHEHPSNLAAAIGYRMLLAGRPRIVHTVHVEPAAQKPTWKRLLMGFLLGRCWVVTVVSAHTASQLGRVAAPVPRRIRIIPGASEPRVRPSDDPQVSTFRARYGLHSGPVVCQIGLNFPLKVEGAIRLIQAFAGLRAEEPGARLLLVGGGRYGARVQAACQRFGVADAVVQTGFIDDISLALAAADVYCHISLQDACPLSLLEAMWSGKPIVAARSGGIPEIVSDGVDGVLVDPHPDQVGAAVRSLLNDPVRAQRLGAAAAATARARFTWDRVAADFASVYGAQPRTASA